MVMDNHYGRLRVPVLNISLEQLILVLYPSLLIPAIFVWYRHMQARKTAILQPAGCVRLGRNGSSHAINQDEGQLQRQLKSSYIDPIKGCASVELDEVDIDRYGTILNHRFSFAELLPREKASGKGVAFYGKWTLQTLHQPGWEKLAFVKSEIWVPRTSPHDLQSLGDVSQTGALVVKFPNIPTGPLAVLDNFFIRVGMLTQDLSFQVPLTPFTKNVYPRERLKDDEDDTLWLNMSTHLPDSFRTYIDAKHPIALFRINPDT